MKLLKPLLVFLLLGVSGLCMFLVVRGLGKHERSTEERERLDKIELSADELHQQLITLKRQYEHINAPNLKSSQRVVEEPVDNHEIKNISKKIDDIRKEIEDVALILAQKEPGSARSLEAIRQRMDFGERGSQEYELLAKDYAGKQGAGQLLVSYGSNDAPASLVLMKAIIEKNPHVRDKSLARYYLALARMDTETEAAIQECEQLAKDLQGTADFDLKTIAAKAAGLVFYHRKLAVGQPVPELEAKDADGTVFKLGDYRGKVIVLHFWGHWQYGGGKYQRHNVDETEFTLDKRALVQRLEGKPFVLLGINTDNDLSSLQQLNRKRKVNWRSFWCGPQGYYEPLAFQWNFYHGNRFLVIDHQGKIVGRNVGDLESGFKFNVNKQLNTMLNELVAEAEKNNK